LFSGHGLDDVLAAGGWVRRHDRYPDPVTTTEALRRATRITAVVAPLTVLLTAAPVIADTPSTWEEPEPMSTLTALLIFVGVPLLAFAVISLLVLAPSLIRGDRQQRGVASWTEPAWFGSEVQGTGPSRGELEAGETETGGASARW
jgi:hypothetical protein